MNQKEYFQNLFEYESWANQKISRCIVAMSNPPEKAISIMSHIADAGTIWLSRVKGIPSPVTVWQAFPKEKILSEVEKISAEYLNYLNEIEEDDLKKVVKYKNSKGDNFESLLKDILTHVIIHSSYHRGQVIVLIKSFTENIPYTDYIHYVRS